MDNYDTRLVKAKLLAHELINYAVERGRTAFEFQAAIFFLAGWICGDKTNKSKQALLKLLNIQVTHPDVYDGMISFREWDSK